MGSINFLGRGIFGIEIDGGRRIRVFFFEEPGIFKMKRVAMLRRDKDRLQVKRSLFSIKILTILFHPTNHTAKNRLNFPITKCILLMSSR